MRKARRADDLAGAAEAAPAAKNKTLTPEARRALQEAEQRRAEADGSARDRPNELGGRVGPDPVRYGDWEKKGIASDF